MIKLREYQDKFIENGCQILTENKLLFLCLETRLGKTIIALNIAKKLGFKNVLFFTKRKIMSSIKSDVNKMNLENIDIQSVDSAHKVEPKYDLIIVDESHTIGAFPKPSKRAKNIKKIVGDNYLILLSATPTPESYSQIYHQFWISNNSPFHKYKNFYRWADDYVNKRDKMINGYRITDYSRCYVNKIKPFIEPIMISYTRKQAGFIHSEVKEKIITIEINPRLHEVLNILKSTRILKKDNWEIVCDTPAKLKSKMHQICSGTVKDENGKIHYLDYSKAAFIKKKFTGKIVIFYKYIGEYKILKTIFPNHYTDPQKFNAAPKGVFISQFQSGREGIRLDTTDHLIYYNIDFSYLSYEQAKSRILDLNRTKTPILYWLFSDTGLENEIYKTVKRKKNFTVYYFNKFMQKEI
jgi:hypothetical protein